MPIAVPEAKPTRPDLIAEISALCDADLLRLIAIARVRARALPGLDAAELLNEAVLRLLAGTRSRPSGVPLIAVLAQTMRSVAHDHWRRAARERTFFVLASDGIAETLPDVSPCADPERALAAGQALADIDRLFADDSIALHIIAGLAAGLGAGEIQRRYAIDGTTYDTARRRIRRALLRRDDDGGRR